jgi:hypothetical protein
MPRERNAASGSKGRTQTGWTCSTGCYPPARVDRRADCVNQAQSHPTAGGPTARDRAPSGRATEHVPGCGPAPGALRVSGKVSTSSMVYDPALRSLAACDDQRDAGDSPGGSDPRLSRMSGMNQLCRGVRQHSGLSDSISDSHRPRHDRRRTGDRRQQADVFW